MTMDGIVPARGAMGGAGETHGDLLERARRLLRSVPLIDGHNDLAWKIRCRGAPGFDALDLAQPQPALMTDIPRLREGLVGAQFWAAYVPPAFAGRGAARVGLELVDYVLAMVRRYPETFALATTADEVRTAFASGRIASLLGLEGGHIIENSLGVLRTFARLGVRYMTLTHNATTDWADAATDAARHDGLSRFGEEVVREMNRLGMLVDLSHVSDATIRDALRVSEAPVICSHSSARRLVSHPRNVPDELAAAVAGTGGVIMVNFVPAFLSESAWRHDVTRKELAATYEADAPPERAAAKLAAWDEAHPWPRPALGVVADHLEHLCSVAGVDHVGIGGDLDGIPTTPVGLEDVSTYPRLVAELLRRGWSESDLERVVGRNVLRVLQKAEAVSARLQREREPSVATIEQLDGWDSAPPWSAPV